MCGKVQKVRAMGGVGEKCARGNERLRSPPAVQEAASRRWMLIQPRRGHGRGSGARGYLPYTADDAYAAAHSRRARPCLHRRDTARRAAASCWLGYYIRYSTGTGTDITDS